MPCDRAERVFTAAMDIDRDDWRRLKRVRRMTGVEGFHVHQMRHTFACQWLERGGSLAALQQVLGHASITTTRGTRGCRMRR